MNRQPSERHIIWSNLSLDVDDWREAYDKPIRLKNLGEEYTNEAIKRRLIENQRMKIEPFQRETFRPRQYRLPTRGNKLRKKGGLYGLYLYYCYRLGYLPKYKKQNTARLHYLLKEDLLKLDRISMEARLLGRENISTDKELFSYKASIENQIETLTDERTHLRKTLRRNLSDDELSKVKGQISTITDRIRTLRKEVTLCDGIAERSKVIEHNLEQVHADEDKFKGKERNRYEQRIIAATKALIAAIAAGGWVAVVVIIVICLIALLVGSVFGIFFSGEDSGTGQTMQTVVQEINVDYDGRLQEIKNSVSYDKLEMSGSRAVWKDVLAVYSVKVNTDPDNAQEVATMNDEKKQLLKDIFWEMNEISSRTETKLHTEITETDDGHGNIVQTETTVTETFLYITVSHKTVDEMAAQYGFNEEQKEYLAELLQEENNSLWSAVLYGIGYSDDQIVTVALSQVGNVGGEPYWSWYGFNSRVEWCACFVSWCANECGYIDAGIIPKYAGCVNGVQWFKDRGQWIDGSLEPMAGMIIFFDWDNKGSSGPQDGLSDHTGIVEKVENGIVYTVEGNSGDSCRINQYAVGHYEILGYGAPQY